MNELVYSHERTLGTITLVLGLAAWLFLIVGTVGAALIGLAAGFVLYLFMHSTLIAHIQGNGVELTESQFPDLYAQFTACCDRLQMEKRPRAYVLNGNGGLNAFATKFLGSQYVVLMSNIVDALDNHVDGVRFYIGHELGHLRMKHLSGHFLRWPILWLPLLGAAYSRARESTCDRHGLVCSDTPEGAARALAALSAGAERWKKIDLKDYLHQIKYSSGFWMSFHELTAGYPWLTKRVARVVDANTTLPKRNPFAYLLAIFIPYAGRLGGGFGLLVMIYIIGVLAAVAIPAYENFHIKSRLNADLISSQNARDTLSNYYLSHQKIPESLAVAGIPFQLSDGSQLSLDPSRMVLTVNTKQGKLVFIPSAKAAGGIGWRCEGVGIKPMQIPIACRRMGSE